MRDHLTAADRLAPHDDKLAKAVAYLRARNRYCLDKRVTKQPRKEVQTILDRWIRGRA